MIRQVTNIRNTLLHGNYEQAARQAGYSDVEAYFREQFAPEIEGMYKLVNQIVAQLDPTTGRPRMAKT